MTINDSDFDAILADMNREDAIKSWLLAEKEYLLPIRYRIAVTLQTRGGRQIDLAADEHEDLNSAVADIDAITSVSAYKAIRPAVERLTVDGWSALPAVDWMHLLEQK